MKDDSQKIARRAYAFSDPLRVKILGILRGEDDVCNCEFQERLNLSQSKASYHLRILMEAGLISREVRGTWCYYTIADRILVDTIWQSLEEK